MVSGGCASTKWPDSGSGNNPVSLDASRTNSEGEPTIINGDQEERQVSSLVSAFGVAMFAVQRHERWIKFRVDPPVRSGFDPTFG
jgi:hypothetical protein